MSNAGDRRDAAGIGDPDAKGDAVEAGGVSAVTDSPASLLIPIDSRAPWAAGHFPGDPILPGAMLLEEILVRLRAAGAIGPGPCQIAQARFMAPVRPGSVLLLSWHGGGSRLKFDCTVAGQPVASGQLMPVRVPAP